MTRIAEKVQSLIDLVQREPGWRIDDTSNGWRIYPPDLSKGVIHLRDFREIDYCKTALRRAGFKPLLKVREFPKDEPMQKHNGDNSGKAMPTAIQILDERAAAASAAAAAAQPRDLIAEARVYITTAVEALAALDDVLGVIQRERGAIDQIKTLFQAMMK